MLIAKCSKCGKITEVYEITFPDGNRLHCEDCFKIYEKKIKESYH